MRLKREVVSKGQGERNSSQNLGKQKSRKLKSYCGYYLPRASFLLLRGKAISTGSKYGFITLKKKDVCYFMPGHVASRTRFSLATAH